MKPMWRMHYTIARNMVVLPKLLETMHRMTDPESDATEKERYDHVRYIVSLMHKKGHIRTKAFGVENLPDEGGYVMYPNHQGKYDAYGIVGVHDKPCTVVMDREKSYYVLIDEIIRTLNGKRMDIHNPRQGLRVINEMAEEVAQGRRYIIFPEGGYAPDQKNTLGEFKPGSFKAAVKAQAPIVPVALYDSWKVFNSWQITPVTSQVHFLEPIHYEQYRDMKTTEIAALVKERIRAKLEEIAAK